MKKTLLTLALLGIATHSIAGETRLPFYTMEEWKSSIPFIEKLYTDKIEEIGKRDLDNDGIEDPYFICKDGTIYAAKSTENCDNELLVWKKLDSLN